MAKFKYNKEFIENMAKEFMELLIEYECADSCSVYFNGMRYTHSYDKLNKLYYFKKDVRSFHPLDINKNAYHNNIVSFSTEGILYDYLYDGTMPKWFYAFCAKYQVYASCVSSWFWSFCPIEYDWEEWETDNKLIEEEIRLFLGGEELNKLPYIKAIASFWYELARLYGNKGTTVLGAGFRFVYKDKKYKLSSCSPYYASLSWEHDTDLIQKCLEHIGCTDIHYDWGNMD